MMILLTGGSACGKSHFAEALCARLPGPRYYIAAMRPYGAECAAGIARHRRQRAEKGVETVERYQNLGLLELPERGTALLECICNLTANEMFDETGAWRDPVCTVVDGVAALRRQCRDLIVVTNEVGSDGGAYDAGTRAYIAAMGRINAALAAQADTVLELVCGMPIVRRGADKLNLAEMQTEERHGGGMILVTGGEGSGKRSFAAALGYGPEQMTDGVLDEKPVLFHAERLAAGDPEGAEDLPDLLAGKALVLCNEVGSGIIPATPEERRAREISGRFSIRLAQRADTVIRMVCGIPSVLKGTLPGAYPAAEKK